MAVHGNAAGFCQDGARWHPVTLTIGRLMQGSTTGRLLSYNPNTKKTHVLADGFWYANGVAIAPDQSFVAFVETMSVSVHKYWLKGPKVCYEGCVLSVAH